MIDHGQFRTRSIADAVSAASGQLAEMEAVERLWSRDHTLWHPDPHEITDRLGWLDSHGHGSRVVPDIERIIADLAAGGVNRLIVCGMGGSSLFADVVSRCLSSSGPSLTVSVLDTTHPGPVSRAARAVAEGDTAVVVASKSGTTVETRAHLDALWEVQPDGSRWVVLTDPGSPLVAEAEVREIRHVVLTPADVGGRFSALTAFGLLPAVAHGADVPELLAQAAAMASACELREAELNPALRLAATLAGAALDGRNKLTLVMPPTWSALGEWIEQLVAESTGKDRRGIVPVTGEPQTSPDAYDRDRLFIVFEEAADARALAAAGHPVVSLARDGVVLGAEVMRWQVAVALAAAVLEVNPFDQPDVAAAKSATAAALEGQLALPDAVDPAGLLSTLAPHRYLAMCAFVDPANTDVRAALGGMRAWIGARFRVATTAGLGPRYLHSTGQLHKGGPAEAVVLAAVDDTVTDDDGPVLPGRTYGFATLMRAQAAGDLAALGERGIPAARVDPAELVRLADL